MKTKRIILSSLVVMLLFGCSSKDTSNEKPSLTLTSSRIQVPLNEKIDYLSYVKEANDQEDGDLKNEISFNEIDTKTKGTQTITYSLKDSDGNEVSATLKVDVVEFFDEFFNPEDVAPEVIDNPEDIIVLVNKVYTIDTSWVPDDLEPVIDNPDQYLRKEANEAYTKFYQAAKKKGIELYSISGYRSNDLQTRYWTNMNNVYGNEYASAYSAYPGRSEHQLGLAMDVSYTTVGDRLSEAVADSDIGKFIISDGYKYGFILRYEKDKTAITNYGYEPWHIRYVGVDLATKLHDKNITLEEYYNK